MMTGDDATLSLEAPQQDETVQSCGGDDITAHNGSTIRGKKRKHNDNDASSATLNETSTIDDLADVDASTYIAWVNRQSEALPSVFVANQYNEEDTKPKASHQEEPIDGSAATLHVMMSKQMEIHPPPSVRHLPPINTQNANNVTDEQSTVSPEQRNCSQWISSTISNFSELRSQIEKAQAQTIIQRRKIVVPRMKDRAAWHVFCLGKNEASGNVGGYFEESEEELDEMKGAEDEVDGFEVCEEDTKKEQAPKEQPELDPSIYNPQLVPPNGYKPTLSLLLQFDQVLTRFLFHHHIHFFCEWKSPLTRNRAAWIYALLARMEKPWHREECSAVRRLLRECCARRHELILPDGDCNIADIVVHDTMEKQCTTLESNACSEQNGDAKTWEQLALLNTLIAITGLYYEQGSMAGGDGMSALFSIPP